jgi:hypothetical protein
MRDIYERSNGQIEEWLSSTQIEGSKPRISGAFLCPKAIVVDELNSKNPI